MVSDRIRQLLSALVDGELSARQQEAVRQVLRASAEARVLLQQLQTDATRLRSLGRHVAAEDFADALLPSLAGSSALKPAADPPLGPRTLNPWIGFPAAAAVLVAVFFGSYRYFSSSRRNIGDATPFAGTNSTGDSFATADSPAPPIALPHNTSVKVSETAEPEVVPVIDAVATVPEPKPAAPVAPRQTPTKVMDGVFTTPTTKQELFEWVDPTLAVAVSLRELDQAALQQKVLSAFKAGEAYRLELTGSSNARAVEAVTKAFQSQGMVVLVDDAALQRTKHPKWLTDYAVLADDVTPSELADVLTRLGKTERDSDTKRSDAARFHDVMVLPLTQDDCKEQATLLGIEPGQVARPSKPSTVQGSPRLVLVLSYNPARTQLASSKEIKRYLEARTPRRPGSVQILILLRAVAS